MDGMRALAIGIIVIAPLVSACAAIHAREAERTAGDYADALNHHDVERMIALTDPEVIKRSANGDELRKLWPQLFAQGDIREQVRDVSPGFSDVNGMHYFVSTERNVIWKDGRGQRSDNYYIVTSRDHGRTWTIVDLSCVDERWIKGIAPGWHGYPPAPKQAVFDYHVQAKLLNAPAGAKRQ
jgi:hypothetical protein